jgi:hypothetical protein
VAGGIVRTARAFDRYCRHEPPRLRDPRPGADRAARRRETGAQADADAGADAGAQPAGAAARAQAAAPAGAAARSDDVPDRGHPGVLVLPQDRHLRHRGPDHRKVALWNTIIGEGDAEHPATAMLVKVVLTGPSFANQDGKLVVVAKEGKRTLVKQTFPIEDYFEEQTPSITLPLLVTGVGCEEITVTATLSGKGKRGTARAVVPFACGE